MYSFFHADKAIPEREYTIYANQTVIDLLNTCASFRLTGWFIYLPHKIHTQQRYKNIRIFENMFNIQKSHRTP